jgi:hypothetical protein
MTYCRPGVILIAAVLLGGLGLQTLAAERGTGRSAVPYVSGGVGEDALARLKAREKEFNLKLVFTLTEGNYLADVGVSIADASGKALVEHVTDGPVFMARLPAGTYVVAARYSGSAQTRKVSLSAGRLHTEYLRWPSDPRTDFPTRPERRSETPAPPVAQAAAPPAPAPRTPAAVISGGVGEESRERLKAREHEFNLKLVFTLIEGNYLADVRVAVRNAAGQVVVEHIADGPFVLARLAPGSYTVTAAYGGQPQTRTIRVSDRLQTVHMQWRSDSPADVPGPRDQER